jgi:hypothetical protein
VFVDNTVEGPDLLLAHGAPLVHGYLLATYEEVVRVGDASVMVREDFARAP